MHGRYLSLCVCCRMQIYLLSEINQCPAHRVQTVTARTVVVLWSAAMSDGSISTPHLNIPNTLVTTRHYQSCSRGGNLRYMLEHTTCRLGIAAIKQTKGWNFLLHPVTTSLLHHHIAHSRHSPHPLCRGRRSGDVKCQDRQAALAHVTHVSCSLQASCTCRTAGHVTCDTAAV